MEGGKECWMGDHWVWLVFLERTERPVTNPWARVGTPSFFHATPGGIRAPRSAKTPQWVRTLRREPRVGCHRDVPEAGPFPTPRGLLWQETHHPTSTCHLGEEEPVGSRSSVTGSWSGASRPPRGKSGTLGPGPRGPWLGGSGGEQRRWGQFRVRRGGEVGARQRAGRLPPRPPGFLRRLRPPCCCGAEAAPRSPSGRDRLRNRFAVGGLATNPAAAAAEQGLPASACARAAGAGVALRRAGGEAEAPGGWSRSPGLRQGAGRCGCRGARRGEALRTGAGGGCAPRTTWTGLLEPGRPPS